MGLADVVKSKPRSHPEQQREADQALARAIRAMFELPTSFNVGRLSLDDRDQLRELIDRTRTPEGGWNLTALGGDRRAVAGGLLEARRRSHDGPGRGHGAALVRGPEWVPTGTNDVEMASDVVEADTASAAKVAD